MSALARACVALVALAAVLLPGVALAHPLGSFTVNRYSRLELAGDGVRLLYVLDMAEIPTYQEQSRLDADHDGQVSADEREAYLDQRVEQIRQGLSLALDGSPAPLRAAERSLTLLPGQGGLPVLRLEAVYAASLPGQPRGLVSLVYRDANEPDRVGWREIVARPAAAGTTLEASSVPAEDRTDALRQYPDDLLSSPLDVREARLRFVAGGPRGAALSLEPRAVVERTRDAYAALAAADTLSPTVVAGSLLVAMVLGALHALSPGHGKTVIAAYLVGSRGTARHALFLGATVTATHTIGVYALGLVTLYLSQYLLPERLYPILEAASGLLVVGIGAALFWSRLRGALPWRRADTAHDHHHQPGQHHGHEHQDAQGHGHAHGDAPGHGHGAWQDHEHEVGQGHAHAGSGHAHAGGGHAHGGQTHSHLPPGAGGEPVTWRSLLALGVSGGLLPCPSALVVLLTAIALHRVLFGLLLIVAFSVGLASVLVGIGLLLVYARSFFQRLPLGRSPLTRLLPVASALLVVLAGAAIAAQALPQLRL